jgi:hypothetical protein
MTRSLLSRRHLVLCFPGIACALLFLASHCAAQQPFVPAPHQPVPRLVSKRVPYPHPAMLRSVAGGLWMTDGNYKSSIYLKNNLITSALEVTPVLYFANGTRLPLAPLKLDAAGTATVSINQALADNGIAPFAQLSGYVEVEYTWPWDVLCVTIHNVDLAHSIIFNFNLGVPLIGGNILPERAAETSETLEGMWWKETKGLTGFVALSNPTQAPRSATVVVTDSLSQPIDQHTVTVSPHGTKIVELPEVQNALGVVGGISVSYQGPEDAIMVYGGLQDPAAGYSANIPFTDPPDPAEESQVTPPSTFTLAEVGLMAGIADPVMSFPAATVFTPYSVMRNASSQAISVKPSLYWMDATGPRSAQLPKVTLLAHQAASLDVLSMMTVAGLTNFSGSVNLVLDLPDSARSSLVVASGSVDKTKNYVFGVMPTLVTESESKTLSYWSVDNGDDTMVALWNPADEGQDLMFEIFFSGGHYLLPIHLGPRATRAFNISEIIRNQIPDSEGNVIPPSVHDGSAQIRGSQDAAERILVAMDASIYNVQKATCGWTCTSCNGDIGGTLEDDPFGLSYVGTKQETFISHRHDGTQHDVTSVSKWTSSNTPVATVNVGLVSGHSPGSLTLSSSFSGVLNMPYGCHSEWGGCSSHTVLVSGPGAVQPTVNIQGSPTYVYIGQDPTVTQINALFSLGNPSGGTYQWSSPDTSISFDNPAAEDVHVTAGSYSGGTNDTKITVNYTLSGQSASPASVMLTKRIFKFLAGDSVIEISAYNGPSQYGYSFNARYNVFANPGGQQVTNGSGVSTSENVTQVSSNASSTPNYGQGALNANSQLLDSLALVSGVPLPANLSIVDSQDLFVGGIYVRNNTITFTSTGVTITNNGPYN